MRAIIVAWPTPNHIHDIITLETDDYIIGVDQAISSLKKQKIAIDLAVGDFDSLEDLTLLDDLEVMKLDPVKDVTDTYQALYEAEKRGYKELVILGGIGGDRVEHFIANLMFFSRFESLIMMDENSMISIKKEGEHTFRSLGYISLFGYPETTVSLDGFKYPLKAYHLTQFDPLGVSNELIEKEGILHVHHGCVLVIESKKK